MQVRTLHHIVLSACALAATRAQAAGARAAGTEPSAIVNGDEVEVCAWQSVVAIVTAEGAGRCTGSLVHPELVITAAHCLTGAYPEGEPMTVLLGEDRSDPAIAVDAESCVYHPDYVQWMGIGQAEWDVAYCRLAEPIEGVPIVPLMAGCDTAALTELPDAVQIGFGADTAWIDPETPGNDHTGAGIKRFAVNPILSIDAGGASIAVAGFSASGGCFGDSGGPLMVQFPDGTMRIAGIASTLNPLQSSPDPCVGATSHFQAVAPALAWLEADSGLDLTPCHDADGTWNPGPDCTAYPIAPWEGAGEWATGCTPPAVTDNLDSCGAPYTEPPPSAETSGGGSSDTSDTSDDADTSDDGDVQADTESSGGGADGSDTTSISEADGGAGGCACSSGYDRSPTALWGLPLLTLVRRGDRRRPAALRA